jgi:hypothetical protein
LYEYLDQLPSIEAFHSADGLARVVHTVTNARKSFDHTLLKENHWELGKVHTDSTGFH